MNVRSPCIIAFSLQIKSLSKQANWTPVYLCTYQRKSGINDILLGIDASFMVKIAKPCTQCYEEAFFKWGWYMRPTILYVKQLYLNSNCACMCVFCMTSKLNPREEDTLDFSLTHKHVWIHDLVACQEEILTYEQISHSSNIKLGPIISSQVTSTILIWGIWNYYGVESTPKNISRMHTISVLLCLMNERSITCVRDNSLSSCGIIPHLMKSGFHHGWYIVYDI